MRDGDAAAILNLKVKPHDPFDIIEKMSTRDDQDSIRKVKLATDCSSSTG